MDPKQNSTTDSNTDSNTKTTVDVVMIIPLPESFLWRAVNASDGRYIHIESVDGQAYTGVFSKGPGIARLKKTPTDMILFDFDHFKVAKISFGVETNNKNVIRIDYIISH